MGMGGNGTGNGFMGMGGNGNRNSPSIPHTAIVNVCLAEGWGNGDQPRRCVGLAAGEEICVYVTYRAVVVHLACCARDVARCESSMPMTTGLAWSSVSRAVWTANCGCRRTRPRARSLLTSRLATRISHRPAWSAIIAILLTIWLTLDCERSFSNRGVGVVAGRQRGVSCRPLNFRMSVNVMDTAKICQKYFNFDLPSSVIDKRRKTFVACSR